MYFEQVIIQVVLYKMKQMNFENVDHFYINVDGFIETSYSNGLTRYHTNSKVNSLINSTTQHKQVIFPISIN